ncbi:hypothetical protein [Glycomyces algeriensis]|uniref:Uncharacterized protein n=1 Tax=Glycomyces algeriensis TaxID=256037 RepID=A0A9W6G5M4_9ACTN|nr:hypothetical protein [Glycomyces algeriensis]MDA1368166.1 hypothetical protein [Glycomyces algeriensis]MDR7348851.1 hypothetical protein [Glycomyces algeriensis]GLI41554.1 hypothetical protein GALLR39Z86_14040 [Glycomyces algeriensis]
MGLISVPVDPVPAWAKIDLQLHQPYHTFLGLGRVRCDWCGEKWGRHGCSSRESAARLFLYTTTRTQKAAALDSGEITPDDLRLRRRTPARHRRKPSPHPRRQPPVNPLAALGITELAAVLR